MPVHRFLRLPASLALAAAGILSAASEPAPFQRIAYHNPGLRTDVGVGLWGWPLPMDYNRDGLMDLLGGLNQVGADEQTASWMGSGPNAPVDPDQVAAEIRGRVRRETGLTCSGAHTQPPACLPACPRQTL